MCFQTKNESLFKENFLENAVERPEHWEEIQMTEIWRNICVKKKKTGPFFCKQPA